MLEYLYPLVLLCLSLLTGYFLTPHFARLFYQANQLARNYQGERIAQGLGIIFPFVLCHGTSSTSSPASFWAVGRAGDSPGLPDGMFCSKPSGILG